MVFDKDFYAAKVASFLKKRASVSAFIRNFAHRN
jgi:hypothetical protein